MVARTLKFTLLSSAGLEQLLACDSSGGDHVRLTER